MESVLLVDDEKDNLEALQRLLRTEFDVTITASGIDALKFVQAKEFAVIVSDQRMPEISGVDLLEKVKQLRPEMVRILLTGYTEVESVIGAINRGSIYRYIAKPWDPEDFKISLRQAAESYRLKKDLDQKNRDLTKSNEALQLAFERVRLLDRAKARFLSLVSHELNTPLTAMNGFVSLLGESKGSFDPDMQRAVASLSSASGRLGEIVSEVLLYVQLEADSDWKPSRFDWSEELQAAAAEFEGLRQKRQLEITVQSKPGVFSHTAALKTRVALRKLLGEAIRRSKPSETIAVALQKGPSVLSLRITWKGAPVETLTAFEPGGNEVHHHRNLALGLSIARLVAERQGGALVAESSPLHGTLQLTLPSIADEKADTN
jgi:two-component system, sensor histidine kinase and response regulator